MAIGIGVACPKPEPRKRTKARAKREKGTREAEVRAYVFGRERDVCRCCRKRRAESMHELRFRSLGGKVSRANSVAVCGDGVNGCHGFLQRNEIRYHANEAGAEDVLVFTPWSRAAAAWMRLDLGHVLSSEPMLVMEAAE